MRTTLLCLFAFLGCAGLPSTTLGQVWQFVASMHVPRSEARAVVLDDGRLLVAGGRNAQGPLSTCELYDPRVDQWTYTGSLNQGRFRFEMVKLFDGRVFAAGGLITTSGSTLASCEIYDPKVGAWTTLPSMAQPREIFGILLLPDSSVLVQAGLNANTSAVLDDCEVFDPSLNVFKPYPKLLTPHYAMNLFWSNALGGIISRGGQIGGGGGTSLSELEFLGSGSKAWVLGPSSYDRHSTPDEGAIQLSDESILVPSGRQQSGTVSHQIELFDPFKFTWRVLDSTRVAHDLAAAVRLDGDTALVVGGSGDPGTYTRVLKHTFFVDPVTGRNWDGPPLEVARYRSLVKVLRQNVDSCEHVEDVLAIGGEDSVGNVFSSCERLRVGTRQNSASISLSPAFLVVSSEPPCFPSVQRVSIRASECGDLELDSIQCADPKVKVLLDSGKLPMPISSSTSISLSFWGSADSSSCAIKFVFRDPSGLLQKFVVLKHPALSANRYSILMVPEGLRTGSTNREVAFPLLVHTVVVNMDSLVSTHNEADYTLSYDPISLQVSSVTPPAGWVVQSQQVSNGVLSVALVKSSSATRTLDSLGQVIFNVIDVSRKRAVLLLQSFELRDSSGSVGFCPFQGEGLSWVILLDSASAGVAPSSARFGVSAIFPNPTNGVLKFEVTTKNPEHMSVTMYDVLGREVPLASTSIKVHAGRNDVTLPMQAVADGIYLLRLNCGDQVVTREVRLLR